MTNKREIKTTIIAAILAVLIAASSAFAISAVTANAATYDSSAQAHYTQKAELPEKTTKLNQFAKAYVFKASGKTSYGYDWTYTADNNNIKVTCKYDFNTNKYTFKTVGKSYGLTHLTIKYKTSDKKWASEKMTVFVDSVKNIMRTA